MMGNIVKVDNSDGYAGIGAGLRVLF
jgi:hypothetical protein